MDINTQTEQFLTEFVHPARWEDARAALTQLVQRACSADSAQCACDERNKYDGSEEPHGNS